MDHPNHQNWFERLTWFPAIVILTLLGLLAYANAVTHPFVHDDVFFLLHNPNLDNLSLKNIFALTSSPHLEYSFVNQYYRPLLELTNRILYKIVHLNPHGFHLFNVVLHITNSFLVYQCVRLITNNKKGLALGCAVFFLVHPVQSEAVACISGISNLVFTFLALLSFNFYLTATRIKPSRQKYAFSILLFIFALLSKEQAVVLPFLLIAYELCFAEKMFKIPRSKIGPLVGFLIVLAVYFLLRKLILGATVAPPTDNLNEYQLILLAIPRSILTYLSILFFPHNLHYYRSQDILLPFLGPIAILTAIVLVVIFIIARAPQPQKSWMAFGLSWFGISLLPTSNVIPMINEYSNILTAEHFLYFPLIGMLLFVLGIGHIWIIQKQRSRQLISMVILGAIACIFVVMTMKQNTFWRGEIPLFERTLRYEKDFGRVHFLLAKAYANAGRFKDAVVQDQKALSIMQGYLDKIKNKKVKGFYLDFLKQIHYHLGYSLDMMGDSAGALNHYKEASNRDPENGFLLNAVGIAYIKVNDFQNAVTYLEKALALDSENLMVMNSLALCYQEIGNDKRVEKLLRTIAEKDKHSISAKQNLENFLSKQKENRNL